MTRELRADIVDGAYWLRQPGPNAEVVVAYTGAVAPEAIEAVGLMAEDRRDVGLLAVTSADRLNAGWTAAQRARERGLVHARSPYRAAARRRAARIAASSPCSTAIRRRSPGSARSHGHRVRALGVEHFGQTGTIADLYRHYGIDANAIVAAAQAIAPGPADPAPQGAALSRIDDHADAEQRAENAENDDPDHDHADHDRNACRSPPCRPAASSTPRCRCAADTGCRAPGWTEMTTPE